MSKSKFKKLSYRLRASAVINSGIREVLNAFGDSAQHLEKIIDKQREKIASLEADIDALIQHK